MSQWIGCTVSVYCGDALGTYQGKVFDVTNTTLTLTKAYRNGLPFPRDQAVLKSCDIKDIKIIELESKDTHSATASGTDVTLAKPIARKANATSNDYSLQPMESNGLSASQSPSTHYGNNLDFGRQNPSLPSNCADFIPPFNKLTIMNGMSKRSRMKKRDEDCFGEELPACEMRKDFDFEKNLALFDKHRVWKELNNQNGCQQKPSKPNSQKLRHDENVISTLPTVFREIVINSPITCREYVTDCGLIVPSISIELRNSLWKSCDKYQFSWERRCELMGRNITEMSLQLLGGSHRLNPYNVHQAPMVLCICGPNRQGAMALNAARQLSTQGVNVIVYLVDDTKLPKTVQAELNYFLLTQNQTVVMISNLPSFNNLDLIILGVFNEKSEPNAYPLLTDWLNQSRTPVLAVDPPPNGLRNIEVKLSLIPALPLSYIQSIGKLYLCNIGIPVQIFNEIGIRYKSPFNSKFVIPLHLK